MSDPAVCPDCKGAMKPLFTGFYCPNNCDKPQLKAASAKDSPVTVDVLTARYKKLINATQQAAATPRIWSPFAGMLPGNTPNYTAPMADDQCRDFYCSGKGKPTHTSIQTLVGGGAKHKVYYVCQTCTGTWSVDVSPSPAVAQMPLQADTVNLRWNGRTWVQS